MMSRAAARHGVDVAAVHLRVTMHHELQYRANFLFQLLQTAWQIGGGIIVLLLVFSKTSELNGWTRSELFAAVGVFTMIGGIMRSVVGPPMFRLLDDVQEGGFDFVLTQPADPQLLVSVRGIEVWQLADVLVGLVVVAMAVPGLPDAPGPGDIAAFLLLLAAGAGIVYWMWFALTCMVFWVTRMPFMSNLMHYVTRASQYPITIYPAWLRVSMTVLVPMGIAVTAPAEAVTSRLGWAVAASALVVAATLGILSRWLWHRALRHYSGASA